MPPQATDTRRRPIRDRLLLAFAVLLAVLGVAGLFIQRGLSRIVERNQAILRRDTPARSAAYELESGTQRLAVSVMRYHLSGNAQSRNLATEAIAALREQLAILEGVSDSPQRTDAAAVVRRSVEAIDTLSRNLMEAWDQREALARSADADFATIGSVIAEEALSLAAMKGPEAAARIRALRDFEVEATAMARAMVDYLRADGAAVREEFVERLTKALAALEALEATDGEGDDAAHSRVLREALGRLERSVVQTMDRHDALDRAVHDFLDAIEAQRTLIRDRVLEPANRRIAEARAQLTGDAEGVRLLLLATIGVGVLVAMLLAWRMARTLGAALRNLNLGAERIGAGDLAHRVPVAGNDELTDLSLAFNRMAERLRDTQDQLAGASAALRDNEYRFRAIVEQTYDAIYITDRDNCYVLMNAAAAEAIGLPKEKIIGNTVSEIHPPETAAEIAEHNRRVMETRQPVTQERTRDWGGRLRTFHTTKFPFLSADGEVLGVIGISRELTERIAAEEEMRRRKEQLQAVLTGAPIIFLSADMEGTIRLAAGMGFQALGVEPEALVGTPLREHEDRLPLDPVGIQLAMASQMTVSTIDVRGRSYEARISPLLDARGVRSGVVIVAYDITDRVRAEDALRLSREYSRGIVESSLSMIIAVDRQRRITEFNRAAQDAFGYSIEEAVGREVSFLYADPAQGEAVSEQLAREGRFTGEVLNRRKNGEEFPTLLSASLLRDGRGNILGAMGVSRDIGEEKRIAEELRRAKEAAEAAARAKSEFLANMSHEIRTPMNGVLGMTGLLLDTPLNPEQREFAETIRGSAESLLTIINDILDFSKIEAGKLDIEQIEFALRPCLEDSVELLAPKAQEKDIELSLLVSHDVPTRLLGDPSRVRQIVLNLVGNAIKFTDRGEVAVEVAVLRAKGERTDIQILVKDTGLGIPKDRLERLFRPFSQVDSSTTRLFGGTGLGLAICRQLVQRMGGTIAVASTPGEGSTFSVTLPLTALPEEGASETRAKRGNLRGVPVLVVDDHPTNRRIYTHLLRGWGCAEAAAAGAAEGLAALRGAHAAGRPFRVALVDMQMPGCDGAQFAAQAKADPAISETRLILLSSVYHRPPSEQLLAMGFDSCLLKPVKQSLLANAIALVLAGGAQPAPAAPRQLITEHQAGAADQRRHRLLLVEDNPTNQKLAVRLLEKAGFTCDIAADGEQALDACANRAYDLILMDCQMPVLDGFEATRRLRERERTRGLRTPIVAMTANALQGDRERCLEAGMDDYITKPIVPAKLIETVRALLPPD